MRWSKLFVGREKELSQLIEAYDHAAKGNTHIISIVAESGFGKTRLAQEFYNWLSVNREPSGSTGYWPDLLERFENNLTVNPPVELCGRNNSTLPYLWWGLRIADPGARNEITAGALWSGVSVLTPHLAQLKKEADKQLLSKKTTMAGIKGLTSLGVDIVGNLSTFGLLGVGKSLAESGKEFFNLRAEKLEVDSREIMPEQASDKSTKDLSNTIISDLRTLTSGAFHNESKIPLVLLLDDAQWIAMDKSALDFFDKLIAAAREENWPLLLIITCWEKEWHFGVENNIAPAKWKNSGADNSVIMLGAASELGKIISDSFSGLHEAQIDQLLEKTDGNPRFLDEILMFLDRNPKYFKSRDQTLHLTSVGEKEIANMDFSDFVYSRFEAAPIDVRVILGLSGLQGMRFSPRIVKMIAENCDISNSEDAISKSEKPFSFIYITDEYETSIGVEEELNSNSLAAEFRLKAYRDYAIEDLGNHLDEEDVEKHFANARHVVCEQIDKASNVDLETIMAFSEEEPVLALSAAAEFIKRASEKLDFQSVEAIGTKFYPVLRDLTSPPEYSISSQIIEGSCTLTKYSQHHIEIIDKFISLLEQGDEQNIRSSLKENLIEYYRIRGYITNYLFGPEASFPYYISHMNLARESENEKVTSESDQKLAYALFYLGTVVYQLDGPKAAREYFVECESIMRNRADLYGTPESRKELANALVHLSTIVRLTDGPELAKPLLIESERLKRGLWETLKTRTSRIELSYAVASLAGIIKEVDGPASATPLYIEHELITRELCETLNIPSSREHLANAVLYLAEVTRETDGPALAKPLYIEYEKLKRELYETFKTPASQEVYAISIARLAKVTREIDGPESAKPLYMQYEQLMRELFKKQENHETKKNLAHAISHLADVTIEVDGPVAAKFLFIENEKLMRELFEMLKTPASQKDLATAVFHLAQVSNVISGPESAKPLYVEMEKLSRELSEMLDTPDSFLDLAMSVFFLATVLKETDGVESALPLFVECEYLLRKQSESLRTPYVLMHLANAVFQLAEVTNQTKGPITAKPLYFENEKIRRELFETLQTPTSHKDLANAVGDLARVTKETDGPVSAKPLYIQNEQLMRKVFKTLQTPESRKDLANAVVNLAQATKEADGPEQAKPLYIQCENLMREVCETLKTPASRKDWASAVFYLAQVTQETDGAESAKPLYMQHEQLMREVCEMLQTPASRKNLANAIGHLAQVTNETDGPEQAKPLYIQYEQLMWEIFKTLQTPASRKDWAIAVFQLAQVTKETDGPMSAKSLYMQHEQLMREVYEMLQTPTSHKDLANAVFHLAQVTKEANGPELAKPLYMECKQMLMGLSETFKSQAFENDLASASFNLLQNDIHVSNVGKSPFSRVMLDKDVSEKYLMQLLDVEKTIEALNCESYVNSLFALRLSRVKVQLIHHYFAIEDYVNLKVKIVQTITILTEHVSFSSQSKAELLLVTYFFEALAAQKLGQSQLAYDSFQLAEKTLAEMKTDYWDRGYYVALFNYYYSIFAKSSGDIEKSENLYSLGLDAAKKFAIYQANDGEEILKCYLSQDALS